MSVKKREPESEVYLSRSITIEDYEGDSLAVELIYDSTDEPKGAALMRFVHVDVGVDGIWTTADDLEALAEAIREIALGMRVAKKDNPTKRNGRRKYGRRS